MHIYDTQTRARYHSTINFNKGRLLLSDLGLRTVAADEIFVGLISSKVVCFCRVYTFVINSFVKIQSHTVYLFNISYESTPADKHAIGKYIAPEFQNPSI